MYDNYIMYTHVCTSTCTCTLYACLCFPKGARRDQVAYQTLCGAESFSLEGTRGIIYNYTQVNNCAMRLCTLYMYMYMYVLLHVYNIMLLCVSGSDVVGG